MRSYGLTDRGKICLAIILVVLIFVVPAVFLAVKAWNGSTPPPDNPSQSADDPSSDISSGPLPDDSGLDPHDPPESGNGEQGSFDPPVDPALDPPKFGPINLNPAAGTMLFLFSPELQDAVDEETVTMIGDFLKSPRNTSNARIAVEMPQISDEDTSKLIAAVADAFLSHDVSIEKLAFATYQSDSVDESFEVKLLFFIDSYQK